MKANLKISSYDVLNDDPLGWNLLSCVSCEILQNDDPVDEDDDYHDALSDDHDRDVCPPDRSSSSASHPGTPCAHWTGSVRYLTGPSVSGCQWQYSWSERSS